MQVRLAVSTMRETLSQMDRRLSERFKRAATTHLLGLHDLVHWDPSRGRVVRGPAAAALGARIAEEKARALTIMRSRAKSLHKILDVNGDGLVGLDDAAQLEHRISAELKRRVDALDADGDGLITTDELLTMGARSLHPEYQRMLDTDGSGTVTLADIRQLTEVGAVAQEQRAEKRAVALHGPMNELAEHLSASYANAGVSETDPTGKPEPGKPGSGVDRAAAGIAARMKEFAMDEARKARKKRQDEIMDKKVHDRAMKEVGERDGGIKNFDSVDANAALSVAEEVQEKEKKARAERGLDNLTAEQIDAIKNHLVRRRSRPRPLSTLGAGSLFEARTAARRLGSPLTVSHPTPHALPRNRCLAALLGQLSRAFAPVPLSTRQTRRTCVSCRCFFFFFRLPLAPCPPCRPPPTPCLLRKNNATGRRPPSLVSPLPRAGRTSRERSPRRPSAEGKGGQGAWSPVPPRPIPSTLQRALTLLTAIRATRRRDRARTRTLRPRAPTPNPSRTRSTASTR
jgi:hypothetical protein